MCILFVCTDPNPPPGGYRLIVASNRDEFYNRPAKNAFLCPQTNIIGGRDMEPGREGGMWLGLSIKNSTIKFGALLNVTGEDKRVATSGRGPLVFNYLKSEENAVNYISSLQTNTYSAFNLFMTEVGNNNCQSYHHSNSPEATLEWSGKRVMSFGNSTPDKPFTKVRNGQKKFEEIIATSSDKDELIGKLVELLKCRDLHLPDEELARRAPGGVNFLSSIFVKADNVGYGTRTHSVILVDRDFHVDFVEHTMKEPIDSDNPKWDVTVLTSVANQNFSTSGVLTIKSQEMAPQNQEK